MEKEETGEEQGPRSRGDRPNLASRLLTGCVVVGTVVYWIAHYHAFYIPVPDFDSYERAALALADGSLPQDFKRLPLFPLLTGLLSRLFTGPRPILEAALVLNLAASTATLLLALRLGRRLLGRLALVPVILLLTTSPFHTWTLRPLPEPFFVCLVLAAVLLFVRGTRWSYLLAGLAALTRPEGVVLLALLPAVEVILLWRARPRPAWTRFLPAALCAAAAVAPVVAWHWMGTAYGEADHEYLDQMSAWGFEPAWSALGATLRVYPKYLGFDWLAVILTLLGIASGLRHRPRLTLSLVGFAVAHQLVVMAFGVDRSRYVFPVLWIYLAYLTAGATVVFRELSGDSRFLPELAFLGAGFACWAFVYQFSDTLRGPALLSPWTSAFFLMLLLAGLVVTFVRVNRTDGLIVRFLAAVMLACTVLLVSRASFSDHLTRTRRLRYEGYAAWLGLSWLDETMQPGERALVPALHGRSATSLRPRQLVAFHQLEARSLQDLFLEADQLGINYVVYWPQRRPPTARERNYGRNRYYYDWRNVSLMEPFERGDSTQHFEPVTSMDLPAWLDDRDVHMYRRRPGAAQTPEDG